MDDVTTVGPSLDTLIDQAHLGAMHRGVPAIVTSLLEQKSRIIANWALRVATLPAFRAMPGLPLEEVQRHVPAVLDGALEAIASSDPTLDPRPLERASELAAAHGEARLHDEFAIGDVLAEFHALRREVWSALWRAVEIDDVPFDQLRALDRRVAEIFDALTIAASEAWVSAATQGQTA